MKRLWILSRLLASSILFCPLSANSQTPVQTGNGAYASTVPAAHLNDDGYYAPTPQTMLNEYGSLFLSPGLKSSAIPTNHWWTDLLIAQRANNGKWFQQQFDGNGNAGQLWAYPGMVQPTQTGKTLYFPNAWAPNNGTPHALAQGAFDTGPGVFVEDYIGVQVGATDVMLGDFTGTAYPAGWVATGDLIGTAPIPGGTWPGESPPVTGLLGGACLNSYRGTNATEGTLTSPTFTVKTQYIDLKVGGGNDTANCCVQLVIGGKVVKTATGQQDATLRWTQWNVASYQGQQAKLVIKDTTSAGWGFILCNFIVGTNSAADPGTLYSSSLQATKATITAYSDWAIDYTEANGSGNQVTTTVARGIPFVWDRISNVSPRIHLGAGIALYNATGTKIDTSKGSFTGAGFAFTLPDGNGGTHTFGVFAPDKSTFLVSGDYVQVQKPPYLVYGFLPAPSYLAEFAQYAFARPTGTKFAWNVNHGAQTATSPGGSVDTTWTVTTAPLKGTNLQTLQGWLPHHYRTTAQKLAFKPYTYLTPRGVLQVAPGNSFAISWPFRGIAPVLPAPHSNNVPNAYDQGRMNTYLQNFAAIHPGSGGDTYWQGKEFGISAQNMTLAAQLGAAGPFFHLQSALHAQLADWYTYTPGKTKNFFAAYPGWGALIGFDSSYGSVGFNDNHFHYGYFALSSALLGMQDAAFLNEYGPMVKLVAKEFNNWDRTDTTFPFMRCFDIWEGHCNAGGVSSPGGENQESSSESMNAWVGMFLAGNMLQDSAMANAGAMGYAIESSAVNEYWQDWQHTNFPAGYGKATAGIVGSGGIAYGTFFSGDPAWIYSIQWTPANHWNNYLVRSKAAAAAQYNALWPERLAASNYDKLYNTGGFILNDTNDLAALGAYPGDYVLAFQAMFDPDSTAKLLDTYWSAGDSIATDATYPGSVYYITHALRGLGDQDLTAYTSIATSQVYITAAGKRTYVIFNPSLTAQTATVYVQGAAVGTILVPAHSLIATSTLGTGTNVSTPYFGIPVSIPGTLAFANFDFGGEGIAYHGSGKGNTAGAYRPKEGIDIEASSPNGAPDGTYDITGTVPGEWLRYTVNIAATGTYSVLLRVASANGGALHIVDEANHNLTGTITVAATGGAQTYAELPKSIPLTTGLHVLRLIVDSGTLELSNLTFYGTGSAANIPLGKTINIKSLGDGDYVSADNAGNAPLIANRTGANTWEQFVVIDAGKGLIALKSLANNQYVSWVSSKNQLIANAATVGTNQKFQWFDQGYGQFSLLAQGNNRFVTVPGASTPLTVTSTAIGAAETFVFTAY